MNYKVTVNGAALPLQTARVSALPLNKVWDGNQRPLEQTEEAYFLSVDLQGRAEVEIEVQEGFSSYELRPKRLVLADRREGNRVKLTVTKPMQFTFEADGSHHALHLFFNPPAQKPEGEVLYYGKGEHKADLIWLESGQTLYLDEGAVVYGVVYAHNAENVRIMGRGVLDASPYRRGNDDHEGGREIIEALTRRGFSPLDVKYYGNLVLNRCRNVLVEGVILRDAPLWSLICRNDCENVVIDNVKLIGHWRYNADGIDLCTSKNVTVKNCFVRSFDDCLVARGAYLEGETGDVENVTVTNCVFWCDWGKTIELWCGQKPTALRNICVTDCYFIHLSSSALNLAVWYGSDRSVMEKLRFRRIAIDGEEEYANLVVEKSGSEGYVRKSGFFPHLFHAAAEKLGVMQGLGTQICAPVEDYSVFKIRLRDIVLEDILCDDKRLRTYAARLSGGVMTIEGLKADFPLEIVTLAPSHRPHLGTETKKK